MKQIAVITTAIATSRTRNTWRTVFWWDTRTMASGIGRT